MERQKIFTNRYTEELRSKAVGKDADLADYRKEEFPYDDTQELVLQDKEKPAGLLQRMLDAESDGAAAKELYKAFSGLSPLEASYLPFWAYLSHVDLYPFVCKRWPEVFEGKAVNPSKYIDEHWFGKDIMQCLSGWWWTVHMTVGDDGDFTLTDFIFDKREDLRQNLGTSTLFRHKPFTRSLLRFLNDNPDVVEEAQIPRCRYIIQHFNRLGAMKQLAYLKEKDFDNMLNQLKSEIMAVKTTADLR